MAGRVPRALPRPARRLTFVSSFPKIFALLTLAVAASAQAIEVVSSTGEADEAAPAPGLITEVGLLEVVIAAAVGSALALVMALYNTNVVRSAPKSDAAVEGEAAAKNMVDIADEIQKVRAS